LAPNGVHALRALGLGEVVQRAGGKVLGGLVMRNAGGRTIGRVDHDGELERYGARSHLLVREGLTAALRHEAAAAGVRLRFGARVAGVRQQALSATVRTEDGTELDADVVVGADGVRSRVREAVLTASGEVGPQPRWAGLLDVGGVTRVDLPDTVQQLVFGRRAFFGVVVRDGLAYWFSNLPRPAAPSREELAATSHAAWLDLLRAEHAGDPDPVGAVLAAARPQDVAGVWPVHDLPPLPTWHLGRTCLVGDAAHAVAPSAGQGASLALEDAAVLARCIAADTTPMLAAARYEALRKARAEKVVALGRRLSSPKAPGPVGARFRDLFLPLGLRLGTRDAVTLQSYRAGEVDLGPHPAAVTTAAPHPRGEWRGQ
jgi:2-polyprenyl-6-methoxyphenol hydroxylase-like FAD-dependent oxidoreductase